MDEAPPTTSSTPARPPEVRRLTRSSEGRVIAGVARGLADYTGLDPVVFRIGFVVLSVAGGAGILAYLLAWLVVPLDTSSRAHHETLLARAADRRWVPAVLIGIALMLLLGELGIGFPVLLAIVLIVGGVLLLRDDEPTPVDVSQPAPEGAVEPVAKPARVRAPRSPLGLYTIGAALLAVGLAAALVGAGALSLGLGQYFGLALAVLGAGLVVGAWWGRSRSLIVLGIVLIPIMLLGSVIEMPLRGTLGDQYISAHRHLDDSYEILAGSTTLDLSRFRFGATPEIVDVDMVVGHLRVYVPPGVEVKVNGTMDAGFASLFGESVNGYDLDFGDSYLHKGSTEGDLVLNVEGGLGKVTLMWADWVEQEIRYRERVRARKQERKEAVDEAGRDRRTPPRRNSRGD